MTTTKMSVAEMKARIAELEATEECVRHNEGTFGGADARRMVGTADPKFAVRAEYETVGGQRRATGPDLDRTPGKMRLNSAGKERLREMRAEVKELKNAIADAK